MRRLLVFDFDGTLADTFPEIVIALNRARRIFGLAPAEAESIRGWVGYGLEHLMRQALTPTLLDDATIARFTANYLSIYAAIAHGEPRLFSGMAEVVKSVAEDCLVVASNKSIGQLVPMIEGLGLAHSFAMVVGGDSLEVHKPDPGVIDYIRVELDERFSEIWMIGDSEPDIELGRAVGARSVGVLWGLRSRGELERAGAEYLVDSPEMLGALLSSRS